MRRKNNTDSYTSVFEREREREKRVKYGLERFFFIFFHHQLGLLDY